MKVVFAATVLLAVLGAAAAQDKPAAEKPAAEKPAAVGKFWPNPLAAAEANNLVAFAAAVKDNGLANAVNDKALVATIFAPSDEAFKALADSEDEGVQDLLADKAKFAEVLKYHVVPGATLNSARITKLIDDKGGKLQFGTLQKEKVNATLVDGEIAINGVPVKGADVQGGKVMIHTISDVLIPPSLMPAAASKKAAEKEAKPASGAASLAAGLALALPLAAAALL